MRLFFVGITFFFAFGGVKKVTVIFKMTVTLELLPSRFQRLDQ